MSDAQILLQAGHEGTRRNSGGSLDPRNAAPSFGAAGTERPEREMTPIVADTATNILKDAGFTVIREDAFYNKRYEVDLAVSLHFDGSSPSCQSGASLGYPQGDPIGSNKPTADLWKQIYSQYWPFRWMADNFTGNLRGYYGYEFTSTSIAEILIEFGEVSCPEQDEWLQPRVDEWLGKLVAHFASTVVDPSNAVPDPGPFEVDPVLEELRKAKLLHRRLGRRLDKMEELINDGR